MLRCAVWFTLAAKLSIQQSKSWKQTLAKVYGSEISPTRPVSIRTVDHNWFKPRYMFLTISYIVFLGPTVGKASVYS